MSTSNIPSAEQLAGIRSTLWHQDETPLLTLDSLRSWIHKTGLVLFTPRASQLPAPAPSIVEGVLGKANAAPTLAETAEAKTLLARLIAEGNAVPLNLLGTPGDTPDFVVSPAVFSYVFTLRGDKAWKLPPATTGAVKVSPLALAAYEALARRVTLSVPELVNELGKEVTDSAVLRALSELWSHLRVIPVPQADGDTMWELMSTRFTKQIKAGANAGQPKAMSALISLYLQSALLATEEEIETILSPLSPRSRIRDVVHALMGARELETIAVDGRTVVYISGELPQFGGTEAVTASDDEAGEIVEVDVLGEAPVIEGEGAIKKFVPKPAKSGTGFAKKFTPRPFGGSSEGGDRERRPFKKPFGDKPSFTKPWDENRPARPAADGDAPRSFDRSDRPARPSFDRKPSFGSKPYGAKPAFGSRPAFGDKPRYGSGDGGTRPSFRRDDSAPRREWTPRPAADGGGEGTFAPRKTFSKPGTFGRKREGGFSPRPSFGGGEGRPPRREFTPREGGAASDRPRREFAPREERRPGSYTPRPTGGDRKPYSPRPEGGGFAPRKPFTPGGKPGGFSPRDGGAEGERPRFRKFDAPKFDRPKRSFNPDSPARSFSDRPARPFSSDRPARPFSSDRPARPYSGDRPASGGGFSKPSTYPAKKPFSKPTGAGAYRGPKPPGTFAKFADGNKPFRKPGPGGKKFGGPKPNYRKREEE
ncbi:hypothetical protein [Granulicella pectinivorans]|uniref:hypothetical protein n=1 Tax=Granulicella pectinivorans TaxID=474950 RepID=UPI000B7FA4DE|nr:hypothetical protein [Granulicella pectinivorans]